ncbi:conserved hypothetical protein; putative acetyltransferase [Bradyrhizobium sp. ORS 278]|uniref:GNAT family N-acetyltransferase n=1 Tax=Bradyrhizobium sp. (strain ORS 278) TaxID=114615 RepID=UPI000150793A|nr:GNAT family N-acetyltransferase [Bradyrhizobium sp. ORS 278]CAL75938.1 conserved hypothetical protein; putative acetyltransferase [Bradyrhizobium sp. ORS 278]
MSHLRGKNGPLGWRAMSSDDLAAVDAIAARVHPGYPEDMAVFAERLQLHGEGCRVLAAATVLGYVISHPWHLGAPPALNVLIGGIPSVAATFYIHDLALLPDARGSGAAASIVTALTAHARELGLPSLSLVAVNGSAPFWRKQGFSIAAEPDDGKLTSYGADACLMRRDLA